MAQTKVPLLPLVEKEVTQQLANELSHQSMVETHQIFTSIGIVGICAVPVDMVCHTVILDTRMESSRKTYMRIMMQATRLARWECIRCNCQETQLQNRLDG